MTDADTKLRRRLEGNVRRYMVEQGLWPDDGRLVVAVSGGPDSTALLLIMSRLARTHRLRLSVAHFDHGLRGAEVAQHEQRFVAGLASRLDLAFIAGSGDVGGRAKQGRLSIEEAARKERYEFLAVAAKDAGAGMAATGHTASDQAETVLMHVLRGAGLDGLAGMSPRSDWPTGDGPRLIRPLLCLTRDDTEAYCRAAGIEPLQDESNQSVEYRRNRVRHELLPLLRSYNPRVEETLVRLADAARVDTAYLDELAEAAVHAGGDTASLARETLQAWPQSLRRRALHAALSRVAGDAQGFSQRHLVALERLVLAGRTGDGLDLPRGVVARLTRNDLELRLQPVAASLPDGVEVVSVPGSACFGGLVISAGCGSEDGATSVEVDAEAAGGCIEVRRRRPGDRFQPLGMSQDKKLQDFLVDAHVERNQRDRLPLFVAGRGIIWVGGLRIADWARPRDGSPTVTLSYRPMNEESHD